MINRLKVNNFKSIRELDIEMRPLMVLVGPNGAGKSNFLQVFKFVRDCLRHQSVNVINNSGGYGLFARNGDVDHAISVSLRYDFKKNADALETMGYLAQFEHTKQGSIRIFEEFEVGSEKTTITDGSWDLRTGTLTQQYALFGDSVSAWAFHHFSPQNMRASQPVLRQSRLNEDGSNLSTVIHSLYSDGDPAYPEIEGLFKVFVPEAEKLVSPLSDQGGTYAAFRQKGLNIPIGTASMSDGTLFGLALIVALFAPDRPSLICIEAPDIELHPYLMQHVAELLRTASQYAQIIITTHSPFLLDYLPPESIAIVEKTNCETKIWWAEDKRGVKQAIRLLGAGEAWRAGHLGGVPA